ncbi:hypothetical protein POM88_018742 [Heracleum sosnowskyi]|uniref:Uncharacterized protein n=1 Tax=Heracleum sosnowskyi TaxID=360622 RepID=A0AAD8IR32_9APIA|nr:hypothetical protein POM88_018742 [Heracleum sosnowskyi]
MADMHVAVVDNVVPVVENVPVVDKAWLDLNLVLLYELDISNNLFSGSFPNVVLSLPSLKFLDIRFNNFKGKVPSGLYDLKLDALFINNNNFQFSLPKNFGNSPVSVVVLANNKINGCFPESIAKMKKTLNELIISNSNLVGCLPPEIELQAY